MFLQDVIEWAQIAKKDHWSSTAALWNTILKIVAFGDFVVDDDALVSVLQVGSEPTKNISRDIEVVLEDFCEDIEINSVKCCR